MLDELGKVAGQSGEIRCLLVEDSLDDAKLFQLALLKSKLRNIVSLLHVVTLEKALRVLNEQMIDVVILDYNLPDSDGLTSIEMISQKMPHLPIVVLTGQQDDELGLKTVKAGAQDYLIKGQFPSDALVRAIQYSIHRKAVDNGLISARDQANKMANFQKTFLASMSHEIRSPLSSMLGFLELMKDPATNESEREQYYQVVTNAGGLLLNLVNDILDASSIQSGAFHIDPNVFSLKDLIDKTVVILSKKAEEKGILLEKEIKGEIPRQVYGDNRRIQQILINLINNAIKFTSVGKVTLIVELIHEENAAIKFQVRDTGIGISNNKMELLFRPFEQLYNNVSRTFGGTGLGLYISQELAQMMGGRITVQSEVGKGSVFEFILSLKLPDRAWGHRVSDNGVYRETSLQYFDSSILLIDDSEELHLFIKACLKQTVREVTCVKSGLEALEHIKTNKYDLILLDMQMPEMNGYETAQKIREYEHKEKLIPVPILALSGAVMREEIENSISAGCNEFQSKPIKKAEIIERVKRMLTSRAESIN